MTRLSRMVIFGILSLVLAACATTASSSGAQTIVITPSPKGNSAVLNVGDTLEVQIPTIPSPGYDWQPQNLDSTILVQEGNPTFTADTGSNSAGGTVKLRFNAVGPGRTTLILLYVNSPTGQEPALSTNSFSMVVEVK